MIIEYKNLMETNGTSFIGQGGDPGAKKWGAVSMGKVFLSSKMEWMVFHDKLYFFLRLCYHVLGRKEI